MHILQQPQTLRHQLLCGKAPASGRMVASSTERETYPGQSLLARNNTFLVAVRSGSRMESKPEQSRWQEGGLPDLFANTQTKTGADAPCA